MAIRQWQSSERSSLCRYVALLTGAQDVRGTSVLRRPKTDSPWSHYGWVCLAARAADCKSVTQKHRRFESCPIHFRLRVRVVYGAILLRWCAATHRRFKSFRKRSKTGIKYGLSVYILRHHVCTESFEDSLTQRVFCVRHIFHSTYFVRINPNGGFIA